MAENHQLQARWGKWGSGELQVRDPTTGEWHSFDYKGSAPHLLERWSAKCQACASYQPARDCTIWTLPNGQKMFLCDHHLPRGDIKKLLKESPLQTLVWRAMDKAAENKRKSDTHERQAGKAPSKALPDNRYA